LTGCARPAGQNAFPFQKNALPLSRHRRSRVAGRFSFKSWAIGEMMVPDEALPYLAREGIRFQVEGPPKYEQAVPGLCNEMDS
jgi:hypothetical protein